MAKRKGTTVVAKSYHAIFPFNLILAYKKGGVFKEMVGELSTKYSDLSRLLDIEDNVLSFVFNDKGSSNIYLFLTDAFSVDVLIHESVHVVSRIFDIMGVDTCEETEEFFAYLMEFMFREIMHLLKTELKIKPPMFLNNAM